MKILFDQGTPVPLRRYLTQPMVSTAYEKGWSLLSNGDLMAIAELEGYDLLITTDHNLRYQQNLSDRRIAIIVLLSTSWPRLQKCTDLIESSVNQIQPGQYQEIPIPK